MANKRHKPEEIVTKLRQVDVLVGQGMARAATIRTDKPPIFRRRTTKLGVGKRRSPTNDLNRPKHKSVQQLGADVWILAFRHVQRHLTKVTQKTVRWREYENLGESVLERAMKLELTTLALLGAW